MGEQEVECLAELANGSIGEPAVGAPDPTVERAAARVDECRDAAVPDLEQHDASYREGTISNCAWARSAARSASET